MLGVALSLCFGMHNVFCENRIKLESAPIEVTKDKVPLFTLKVADFIPKQKSGAVKSKYGSSWEIVDPKAKKDIFGTKGSKKESTKIAEKFIRDVIGFTGKLKLGEATMQKDYGNRNENKFLWCVSFKQTFEDLEMPSQFVVVYIADNEVRKAIVSLVEIIKKIPTGKLGLSSAEAIQAFNSDMDQAISKHGLKNISFKWKYVKAKGDEKMKLKARLLIMNDITIKSKNTDEKLKDKGFRYLHPVWDLGSVIRVSLNTGKVFRDG